MDQNALRFQIVFLEKRKKKLLKKNSIFLYLRVAQTKIKI